MKQIILAWLNANGTNEQKANEIDYQCKNFTTDFAYWLTDSSNENVKGSISIEELLEIYKKEKGL
jgi:hypothetical protein